jgi:hypothetical protein
VSKAINSSHVGIHISSHLRKCSLTDVDAKKMGQSNISSNNERRTVFVVLAISMVVLVVDTSIVKIYRLITTPIFLEWDIAAFIVISIVYAVAQYVLLKKVRSKTETTKQFHLNIVHKIVSLIQYILIVLLAFVILQMILISAYNIAAVAAAIAISYILSIVMSGLLALRFFSWFRSTRNTVVLAYTFTAAALSVNAGFTLAYVVDGLLGVSAVVRPHIGHIAGFAQYSISLNFGYVISSIASFIMAWIATILLLRHHSKKLGAAKYWVLVTIPLAYFLGQFQPLFLDMFSAYRLSNPILFNVFYTVIFNLSKPVGGILFGIAFWIIARNVRHSALKDYLMIAGYGLLLLFTSNQAAVLINSPYPPFGMATVSFVGLSSYLVLVGIYSSAVSVAEDSKLRQSIRKMIVKESKLLDSIGSAQMEQQIQKRVIAMTKQNEDVLANETGVEPSLSEVEVKQYLQEVLKEIRKGKTQNGDK